MKISCYIIDDEPLAIEVLESHIRKLDSIEVKGTFRNAITAIEALNRQKVDLLFLDIQMPRLSGLDMLKSLSDPPEVILTTAYPDYALEGFELDVTDYLLKPISFERFLKAVNKIWDKDNATGLQSESSEINDQKQRFFVSSGNKNVRVSLSEMLYLESKGDYVHIITPDNNIRSRTPLSYFEKNLPSLFIRIHRSFIVNIDNIDSWSQTQVEVSGQTLPIGRSYKKQTLDQLEDKTDSL